MRPQRRALNTGYMILSLGRSTTGNRPQVCNTGNSQGAAETQSRDATSSGNGLRVFRHGQIHVFAVCEAIQVVGPAEEA